MSPRRVVLGGQSRSPRELWEAARCAIQPNANVEVVISLDARERIQRAAEVATSIAQSGRPVYGINTGVGNLANVVVPPDRVASLQQNLIRSHCCGVGQPLSRDIVMAMWLLRINSIAKGYSGARLETIDRIVEALNAGLLAVVPSRGSVGASGDLVPSAHATLALLGEGRCTIPDGDRLWEIPASEGLRRLGLEPITLGPKEGLSLINGTQLTSALLLKAWYEARILLATANLAAGMSCEGLHGSHQAFDERVLALHGHPGTVRCGGEIRDWVTGGSEIQESYASTKWIQDPYCLRCSPQVHGAISDELDACEEVLRRKLNGVADNPLLFADDGAALSCGNFHAIQGARACDRIASALTTLASISERRINMAMDGRRSGLPDFLIEDGGVQSGLMMAQVTAAALVGECKALSFPASVDSISTNNDQEDHVSMGPTAGFKALEIVERARYVLAIELLTAAQAIELRAPKRPTMRLAAVHARIRESVAFLSEDRALSDDIELLTARIAAQNLFEP